MSPTFRLDDRGAWSGGGAAFLANWRYAASLHPRLAGEAGAVSVIPRNVPVERRPRRPFVLAPQNAWAWSGNARGPREKLRRTALAAAGRFYAGQCAAQLRISSSIPPYFDDERSSPVIHNVLDPDFETALRRSADATPLPRAEGAFVSLGSVTGYRNLDVLLDGYAAYRREGGTCGLVIAGPPSNTRLAARLAARARSLPGASTIWTRVSRDDVLATLAQARGVVLPSGVEASPLSLLEALATTPRVIASDISAHREILGSLGSTPTAGYFEAANASALSRALHDLELTPAMPEAHDLLRKATARQEARETWASRVDGWLADVRP